MKDCHLVKDSASCGHIAPLIKGGAVRIASGGFLLSTKICAYPNPSTACAVPPFRLGRLILKMRTVVKET